MPGVTTYSSLWPHQCVNWTGLRISTTQAGAEENLKTIKEIYKNQEVARILLAELNPNILGRKKHGLSTVGIRNKRLVAWVSYVYKDINEEQYQAIYNHMKVQRYNQSCLKNTAHFQDQPARPGF